MGGQPRLWTLGGEGRRQGQEAENQDSSIREGDLRTKVLGPGLLWVALVWGAGRRPSLGP